MATLVALAATAGASVPLPRATPAEHAVDPARLSAALQAAGQLGYVRGMVVARDGVVVGEQHWVGAPTTLHQSRSITKSVTSLLVEIAIERGFIPAGLGARLVDYLPARLQPSDPLKRRITLGDLLIMASGLDWNEDTDVGPWLASSDPVAAILSRRMVGPPGTVWNYNTAAAHLLSVVIAEATGMSTLQFADANLFGPLGITERSWLVTGGYHNGGHGLSLSTEDMAKLGVLLVNRGNYDGRRILASYWLNVATFEQVHRLGTAGALTDLGYGLLWWLGRGAGHDIVAAWGWGGQFVFCAPALKLTVAVHARDDVSRYLADRQAVAILDVIVNRIIPAVTDRRVFSLTGQAVPELAAVDVMTEGVMKTYGIQAATTAIVKDGRLVFARGYTWDEPDAEPVAPTALFRSGSIGKSLASIAIHQLIERGLLAYDTPVIPTLGLEPLPGRLPDPRLEAVTVDHLLTHTGGLYSSDNIFNIDEVVARTLKIEGWPSKQEITSYIVGEPFRFDPGTSWDYNNYGYIMLDLLTRRLTGEDFVNYSLDHIFRPVGVGRARLAHMLPAELAPTEVRYEDGLEGDPYSALMEHATAAGGWVLSAPDLARVYSALFDSPTASGLMSAETRAEMLELPFPASQQLGYGRGWCDELLFHNLGQTAGRLMDPNDGLRAVGHGGGGTGVHTLAIWRGDGIVYVLLTNKDPVIESLDFPEITPWPAHDLWASVGIGDEPAAPAPTEAWVPVVARTGGYQGSQWRSDVGLLNRSTLANHVRLRFYGGSGPTDRELVLAAGEYRKLTDVMATFGSDGKGPLRVFSSEPLNVTSRTYNHGPAGTAGQFYDSTCFTCGLAAGDQVVLMQLREDVSFRSSIGILNSWKRSATVEVALHDGDGSLLATFAQEIPPESTVQIDRPFFSRGGRANVESGYATVRVVSGERLVVYGSVVDNLSNDPTTVVAKPAPGDPHQWVAAAAHVAGAHSSQWRTDLAILNRSGAATSVTVTFHGSRHSATASWPLANGEQLLLADVVARLGATGSGAIQVTADQPVLVSSRTYNWSEAGTSGQYYDGTTTAAMAAAGQSRWLSQLEQNSSFRSNVGIVNSGGGDATVVTTLFDGAGVEIVRHTTTLSPASRVQLDAPFSRLGGRNDVAAGYARIEVVQGEGVFCYASVIDNLSNDPTTIPGKE